MPVADQMIAQILDPFRIGLLVALVLTAYNTVGTIGLGIPLLLGCVFVAVIIPITTQVENENGTMTAVLTGLVVNAAIVGLILGARALWLRFGSAGRP